ncbi:MAG: ATP-dependent endonuclease [Erysipelotrichia bacterium]|nr:ATP-dependent endonuclease [Erysipelotrichia bacterium]
MHILSSITIKNFKSVKDFTFLLTSYTPLVGYNNAGKSNILEAIKWLLNKSSLDDSYFNNINEAVEVSGRIEGINEELLNQLPQAQRNSIMPYIIDEQLDIKRVQQTPSIAVRNINLEVKKINETEWVANPNGLDAALKSLFPEPIEIGAMENAAEDASKSKNTTTIGKLIAEIMAPIETNHTTAITEALKSLKNKFEADGNDRATELTNFDTEATTKLQEYFPGISIKLHVPTPVIKEVFKGGTLKVYENDGIGRELTSYGHGTQRSIQMTLIQHLADMKRGAEETVANTLLLIDEPELYLHPQAIEQVRSGLKILSKNGYQVVFTTHSPQMIPSEDIKYTLLIRKNENGTHARERLINAVQEAEREATSQFELLFSLEYSNQILFSEKVLLTEGKTEKRLLPYLFTKFHNKTLGQSKIAFTELGGSGSILKSMHVLNRMNLPCKAIVDLDFAFKEASKNGLLVDGINDSDFLICKNKFMENSDISTSEDGLPKNGTLKAFEAYEWLAVQTDIQNNILNLHTKLKSKNIWLWTKGAIEKHLNLSAKTEHEWASFKRRLDEGDIDSIVTDEQVIELLKWLNEESEGSSNV